MWMAYREAGRPGASDVRHAVELLQQRCSDLAFEASHERVYDVCRWYYDVDDCDERERKYENAVNVCDRFLEGHITTLVLIESIVALGLEDMLEELRKCMLKERLPSNATGV